MCYESFNIQVIIFCYLCKYITEGSLYNWKASYRMKLLISSSNNHGEFIYYNSDKIVFILFNTVVFSFSLKHA